MIKKVITIDRKHSDNFKYNIQEIEVIEIYIFGILIWSKKETITNNNDNELFKGGKTIGF